MSRAEIVVGDCRTVMRAMPSSSIDAIVCDPPYGLNFMSRPWDHPRDNPAFDVETWRAALDVLKPGGHLLAFGGTRMFHRMTVAIEDAGFEIRDCLSWLYGSGFPKSLDVSKQIDKLAGAEREIVGRAVYGDGHTQNSVEPMGYHGNDPRADQRLISAPATVDAARWDGWGTALKPTVKPISLMRWLVQMITPPGGAVLDPFAGSGSTGCAAALLDVESVLIELDPGNADVARRRVAHWQHVRERETVTSSGYRQSSVLAAD